MAVQNNWFILGAGAIGCLWAAHLHEAGIKCTLVIRPESWGKYDAPQLTLHADNTEKQFSVSQVSADTVKAPIRQLILTVKAGEAINAINSIKHAIAHDAIILILLNGLGIQQEIVELLPGRKIWLGSTTDGAWKEKPLTVHHAGKGVTWIGPYDSDCNALCPIPTISGLDIRACNNIHTRLWHKLAINSVINGLTARYHCTNGELLTCKERIQRIKALASESEQVLNKSSIPLAGNILDISMQAIKSTAANRSSTLQDVINKQPTELPWINGFLINEAKQLDLELHEHKRLMHELHQMKIQ